MAWLGNFFSGGGGTTGGSEFVGQYVDIGQQNLRIKKVIAEGWKFSNFFSSLTIVFLGKRYIIMIFHNYIYYVLPF